MNTFQLKSQPNTKAPWNKRKLIGPKPPLKTKDIWSIRSQLKVAGKVRDLAMFDLALDSKLRACDLVAIRIVDIAPHGEALTRATVRQRKTGRAVTFELTANTRDALTDYLGRLGQAPQSNFLFPSRSRQGAHLSTRQYARLLTSWLAGAGLDPSIYGTHSIRRTKATMIYRKTGNLRAIQILLGHSKIESTVRYLGVEIDDALEMAEQIDV